MKSKRNGWIGIDIGTHSVKLAQVRRTEASTFELAASAIILRDAKWDPAELVKSPARSSAAEINAACEIAETYNGRQAACAMPIALCEVRSLEMPSHDEYSIANLIANELERIGTSGNYVADYCGGDNQLQLLAGFLPKRWSDQIANDAERSSLDLQTVEISPLTLTHAALLPSACPLQSVFAILDWGTSSATLSIVKSGTTVFARKLPNVGLNNAACEITSAIDVAPDEAFFLLRETGLPAAQQPDDNRSKWQNVIADTLGDFLSHVHSELRRTLEYIENRHQDWIPSEMILFGGGSTVPNICQQITDWIDLPCRKWQFKGCNPATAPLLGAAISLSTRKWSG